MLNSTLQSENLNSSNINSILDEIVSDSIVLFISLFGIFTNIGAIFILSSTPSIRRSRPFTLLVNQCLMDTVALVTREIVVVAKYALKSDGLHGIWDQFRCHLLDNGSTPMNMRRAVFSIWLFSVITMFSHSVGTNGIALDFRYYYWTVRHGISSKMYAISFNLTFSICPFDRMLGRQTASVAPVSSLMSSISRHDTIDTKYK